MIDMTNLKIQPAILSRVPPFSGIPESERLELLSRLPRLVCPPRTSMVRAEDSASCGLYVLVSGRGKLTISDPDGHQVMLAPLQPGDIFGQLDPFGKSADVVTAVATETCEVLHMPSSEFAACMTAHPRAALFLVTELARRLELAYRKIASFAFDDVRARVAQALLDYAKPQGDVWINVVGSEELARIVGASREMVSRVLKGMATIGLIRRARRTVVIPAREALLNACVHRPPSPDTHRQHGRSSQTTSAVM
jgi:CRP/FNR family cyclic AMP-dependent transcriptional regulator